MLRNSGSRQYNSDHREHHAFWDCISTGFGGTLSMLSIECSSIYMLM